MSNNILCDIATLARVHNHGEYEQQICFILHRQRRISMIVKQVSRSARALVVRVKVVLLDFCLCVLLLAKCLIHFNMKIM